MGRNRGLTLIELLVTLAVLVTMVTLGVPKLNSIINNNRRTTQVNDLVMALNLARSEAAKRGNFANVCASADGTTCSGINTWQTGWIVYSDDNSNGAIAAGEPVLRAFAALTPTTITLTTGSGATTVNYTTDGSPDGAVTFTHCDTTGATDPRAVVVSAAGLVNTTGGVCP